MPTKHPDHDQPQHGTYATVNDVALRWGREASDAEAALIDLRLGDVERMILRQIPDLALRITDGRVSRADVVQVEAEVVLRLMRNPQGFISETDGDYSYQIARELSTGRLNILDEEWRALGYRPARMSILVPEPVVEGFEALDAASKKTDQPFQIVVEDEAALLPHPQLAIAVTRTDRQLWLYDPSSVRANPAGWVKVGGSASGVQDGVKQGQLLIWDATLDKWVPGRDTAANGDGYTLVWSNRKQQWTVNANRLQDLTDVHALTRHTGAPLGDGDMLQYDAASSSWVVVEPSAFLNHMTLTSPASGDIVVFNGTDWVNVQGYSKADVDQKLSNVVSGLARKPAVQDLTNDPPAAPVIGQNYIVGKAPTGLWVGHPNEVTFWDGSNWVFEAPVKGDTHTNLTTNQAMTWNATDWVSLGSQASALKDLSGVHLGVPATDEVLTFDGADWVNKPVPAPSIALDDLVDVDAFGPVGGNILTFDDTTGMWAPGDAAASALDDLTDVAVPAPVAGDILSFDATANAWIGRQPSLANPSLDGLVDVNAGSPDNGDALVFDGGEWFPTPMPTKIVDLDVDVFPNDGELLLWDLAADAWVPQVLSTQSLSNVSAVDPVDGQTLVWSDDDQSWEPATPKSQLSLLTDVNAPTPSDGDVLMFDPTNAVWISHHLDLRNLGDVDTVTSAPVAKQLLQWDGTRWVNKAPNLDDLDDVDTGTTPPANGDVLLWTGAAWQNTPNMLGTLGDVNLTNPVPGQILTRVAGTTPGGADDKWVNLAPTLTPANVYTKTEIDAKVTTLVTGLEHGVAVQAIVNDPPTTPVTDEVYIVGATPTGLWTGHANELVLWDGAVWQFAAPQANETHMVEADTGTWHWNGTAWVKVAAATTASASVSSLAMVGDIKESVLTETQFKAALPAAERTKWVLADGRNVAGTAYATITGQTNVPDLRGAFLRMAGQNNSNTSWNGGNLNAFSEDTTRAPRNTALTGVTNSNGDHYHQSGVPVWNDGNGAFHGTVQPGGNKRLANYDGWSDTTPLTGTNGAHTHTVTINGGGDSETKPKSFSVNLYIKVDN